MLCLLVWVFALCSVASFRIGLFCDVLLCALVFGCFGLFLLSCVDLVFCCLVGFALLCVVLHCVGFDEFRFVSCSFGLWCFVFCVAYFVLFSGVARFCFFGGAP